MLALAGPPGHGSGFIGKFYLIEATVDGDYTWLGVIIVIGSMVSLAYYLRVVAAVWMRPDPAAAPVDAMPAIAGGSPEVDAAAPDCAPGPGWWLVVVAGLACATATVVFGIAPSPLIDWASHAACSLTTAVWSSAWFMALALLPVAFLAGFTLADQRRATTVSLGIWLAALVGLLVAKLAGDGGLTMGGTRSRDLSDARRPADEVRGPPAAPMRFAARAGHYLQLRCPRRARSSAPTSRSCSGTRWRPR